MLWSTSVVQAQPWDRDSWWLPWGDRWNDGEAAAALAENLPRVAGAVVVAPLVETARLALQGPLSEKLPAASVVTRRADQPGRGPVVVCLWPRARDIQLAYRRLTPDGTIVIAEDPRLPLAGWARRVGSLDLNTGQVAPALTEPMIGLLDDLAFEGNNGWGDDPGKRGARRILRDLADLPDYNWRLVRAAMIAYGCEDDHLQRLAKLAPQTTPTQVGA